MIAKRSPKNVSRSPRCLILSQEFPPGPGGLGAHAFEIARHLTRLGWNMRVVTNQDHCTDDEIAAFNASQPFTVRRATRRPIPLASFLTRWMESERQVRRFRPDLMMATGDRAVYTAAGIAGRYSTPWMAVEHGTIPRGLERRAKVWAYSRADALVCVSNYTWGQAQAMGIRPKRLSIIPNGADSERFHPLEHAEIDSARASFGLTDERILLTVGSVSHRKGQDNVIRAMPRILDRFPNTVYLCAGLKLAARDFQILADELGVGRHVRFLGPVANHQIVQLMNVADVFLMTSRHTGDEFEGYGIAAVEAALCGTPSIVTGDSGLSEAIIDGETGLTVPQNQPDSIADSVIRLLQDDALRRKMGHSALIRASSEQTWEQRAFRYDELFRRLIQPRTPA